MKHYMINKASGSHAITHDDDYAAVLTTQGWEEVSETEYNRWTQSQPQFSSSQQS